MYLLNKLQVCSTCIVIHIIKNLVDYEINAKVIPIWNFHCFKPYSHKREAINSEHRPTFVGFV